MTNQGDTEMSGKEQSLEATESPVLESGVVLPSPYPDPLEEEIEAFKAALNEDMGGVISAIGFWPEERLERLCEAAQMLDAECQWFLDASEQERRRDALEDLGRKEGWSTQAAPQPPKNSPASRKGE